MHPKRAPRAPLDTEKGAGASSPWPICASRRPHTAFCDLRAGARTLVITSRPLIFSVTLHDTSTFEPAEIARQAITARATIATTVTTGHASQDRSVAMPCGGGRGGALNQN